MLGVGVVEGVVLLLVYGDFVGGYVFDGVVVVVYG